jgi:hypothetical protein
VLNRVVVRDRTGGIQAEPSFAEGELKLHAHKGVVEARAEAAVSGVGGNIQNGEGRGLHCGLELGKRSQCQGRANHAAEVC